MPNYSLRLRPRYRDDELTGPEQVSAGIGSAIGDILAEREARRAERNTMAAAGAERVAAPPTAGSRIRGIAQGIRGLLGGGREANTTTGTDMAGQLPPGARDGMVTPGHTLGGMVGDRMRAVAGVPNPWNPAAGAALPQPMIGGRAGGALPQDDRPMPRASIANALDYEIEGRDGARYRVDPLRQKRGELALEAEADERKIARARGEEDRTVQALVTAGMPEAEARARVRTNTMRYDETFGPRPNRLSEDEWRERQRFQQLNREEQAKLVHDLRLKEIDARARSASGTLQSIRDQAAVWGVNLRLGELEIGAAESSAKAAEGARQTGTGRLVAEATPEGRAAVARADTVAAEARRKADSTKGAVIDRLKATVPGISVPGNDSNANIRPGARPGPPPKPAKPRTLADAQARYNELKQQRLPAAEIRRIMSAEGYKVR